MTQLQARVILVEDDEALRLGTLQGLELEGLAVESFADARSALDVIDRDFPGVVVAFPPRSGPF